MKRHDELDILLKAEASRQSHALKPALDNALHAILAQAGQRPEAAGQQPEATGQRPEAAVQHPETAEQAEWPPMRRRRYGARARLATAIAVAAAVLLLIAAPFFVKRVVVEGETYLIVGDSVEIDGERYLLQPEEKPQRSETALARILDTNQYVKLPEAPAPATGFMVFPPGSGEQPQRKNEPRLPEGQITTAEAAAVYPTIPGLVVRSGPGMQYAELAQLYTGQLVWKMGMYGNWAILAWEGGLAYAFDDYLFEAPGETPAYWPSTTMHATEPVNVRAKPGSRDESAVLGELLTGEPVCCTGVIGEWSQIEWDGGHGYVFSQYLKEQ